MIAGRFTCSRGTFAIVVGALIATVLFWSGAPRADAQAPEQVTFGLEGCRITAGATLPIDGRFVCPDNMYTTGSLGSNWSELDLVPFRLVADNHGPAQTYTVAIAGDFEEGGVQGYDVVSAPVLNSGLSDSTCQQPQAGGQQVRRPGLGGADASLYRNLTISQTAGEYCVYDYSMRLALGSSDYPGASLSGRFGSENFTSSTQNIGLQTAAVEPQQLRKTINALRGSGFLWDVTKSSVPSQISVDTCLDNPTTSFITTITWTRTPVTGDVTWTSTVLATNPSNRNLIVRVTDVVRADGAEVDTTTGDPRLLPAGAVDYPVLTHSGTAPAGTTTVSDTASAAYFDAVTAEPIPQHTSATASAPVVDSPPGSRTAEITDVTTSSGVPISVDSLNSGTVDVPLRQPLAGPITWESGTVQESGAASMVFTAYLDEAFNGEVDIADTATLVDSGGGQQAATSAVAIHGNPASPTITFIKTVDVPPTEDASFRFGLWFAGQDPATDPAIISGPVTIQAGSTQSQSIAIDVPPSPTGYLYVEEPAPGYVGLGNGLVPPLGLCDALEGQVANQRLMGTIRVIKVVEGDQSGADATATVAVDCEPGTVYDQTLTVPPGTPVETGPIPSGTECKITEPTPPPGYQRMSITPSQVVVLANDTVDVTVTNARLVGELVVTKVIEGEAAGAGTTFTFDVDCDGDAYDDTVTLTVPAGSTQVSSDPMEIPVGVTCEVAEEQVPDGWGLSGITPDSGVVTIDQGTSEVTVTNTRQSGSLVVQKVAVGDPTGADPIFTVEIDCDNGFSQELTLDIGTDGGDSTTIDRIPSGVICTVTEPTTPDGWSLASIEPDNGEVTIGADTTPVSVTVTNERDVGTIAVEKAVVGDPAGSDPTATVVVACQGDDYDQTLILGPGETVQTDPIPTGLECTISEPNPPPGWGVTIDPDTVVVGDGPPVQVTVTNTRQTGAITVVKRLVGPVAGAGTEFTLVLDCDPGGFDQQVTVNVTDGVAASETVGGIPTGTICNLTEPEPTAGWRLASILPSQVVVGDQPVRLMAVNRRLTGGLEIYKHLLGPVDGAPTTFSAFLNCDGTAFDQNVVIEVRNGVSTRTVIRGIPTGVTCTAEEVSIPPKWSLGGVANDTVTITDTELVTVLAVNTRVTGELTVVKAVRGDPSDRAVSFDLVLDCDDNLFDTAVPVDVRAGDTRVEERFSGIPTGVTCSVSEEALPTGWDLVSIRPAQAEIKKAEAAVVTVLNRLLPRDLGPIENPPEDVPPVDGGELPDTGSQLSLTALLLLLALAALAIAVGIWLITASLRMPRTTG